MLEMGMLQLMLLTPTSELSNLLVQLDNVLVHSPMPLRPQVTINSAPAPSRSVAADTSVNFPCMQGDEIEAAQGPKKASVPSVQSNDQAMASAALPTPSSQAANSWCVLVDDVCKARPALAFVLKRSHLIAFGHEAVQVVFEHKTFWWHAANNAYKRSLICSLLCKQFSEDIALQIVALDALSGQRECKSCEGWQAIEVQALAHEGVHAIASILGREVRCIEPVQNEVVDNQLGAHLTKSDERWAAMTPSQGSFWSSHACLAIASALQHISPTTSSTPCSITHSKASPVSLHMPLKRSSRASLGDSNAKH
ncbi:hypothetical protein [Sporisorium scitamineum]|nr:hypothetical protein [Sporisorium scitamineum]